MEEAIPEADDREPICQDPELKAYPQPSLPDDDTTPRIPTNAAKPEIKNVGNPVEETKNTAEAQKKERENKGPNVVAVSNDKKPEKPIVVPGSDKKPTEDKPAVPGVQSPSNGQAMIISRGELDYFRSIFEEYDIHQTGTVDRESLFSILLRLGYPVSDNDMLLLIPCCGLSFSNSYSFQAVISIVEYFKIEERNKTDTRDIDLVWEQLGGPEKGFIKTDAIKDVIKQYSLPLDLDFLMKNQMGCTDEQIERQEITLDQLKALLMEPDKF